MKITAYSHHPRVFSAHSGMNPLASAVGANTLLYEQTWQLLQHRSWRFGQWVRDAGIRHFGSQWNALVPYWSEWQLARQTSMGHDIAHFIWAEFASPRHPAWFRAKAKKLVGTFHASARKLPMVLDDDYRALMYFDGITLMSSAQRPFFLERGVPEDRMRVILHGVDTRYFCPPMARKDRGKALRGLMVGSTERDHAMMKAVLDKLPAGVLEMTILTAAEQRTYYYHDAAPHTSFPTHLSDTDLLEAYQQADLLVMPMIDCTANNAVMESMACGTPVMVNRVGGIAEYVDPACNIVIDHHAVDNWIEHLIRWNQKRDELEAMRDATRSWAVTFDWNIIAGQYLDFYREVLAVSGVVR